MMDSSDEEPDGSDWEDTSHWTASGAWKSERKRKYRGASKEEAWVGAFDNPHSKRSRKSTLLRVRCCEEDDPCRQSETPTGRSAPLRGLRLSAGISAEG